RLDSGPARGAKMLAVTEGSWRGPVEPGSVVRIRGVAKPPVRSDEARFDWPAYLRRQGIAFELHLTDFAATGRKRGGIAGVVDAARRRAERAIEAGLPPDKAALMRGMVLGQDEAIDALTRDDWRDSGLAHLLAVSGQNVMLLCALALPLLALAGVAPRTRVVVLLALIALYVPLAGAGPSLQRAAVMGAAGLVALASSRPASASYALLLAAVATLVVNPRVGGDPGWQLSFAAVAGILAARPLAPRRPIAGALWLTAVASLATTPLLALHFEAVPLASIPANLAALPAVAPVMWAGMLQAATGQLSALGSPGEAVGSAAASVIALLSEPLLAWLELVAARFAELPHAVAAVTLPGPIAVGAAYAALVSAGLVAARLASRAAPFAEEVRARARVASRRKLAAAALALSAAIVLAAGPVIGPSAPDRLTVSFLDVGQGDATLIQHPDGSAVLFDGGPAEARVARLLRQAGVRRLSAVVATHASADHHGGLAEVIRRFPVDLLLDGGDGTADSDFRRLLAEARSRNVQVLPARAGQEFRAGGLAISILSPPRRPAAPPPEDPNPRAVVAIVSSGEFELMLSADAESPTLAALDLPDVDAIKVPHHGSADPGLGAVLERLRPEVAVIEVGENSYGHPHPDTLRTLERSVPHVRRTDRDGTVRLVVEGERMMLD
ncbi:MAG: ComEC/Rec2 family competence protein, partial [Actinomycetota bacterium]|nr:ComEC/Rec2 family competence protein [Actinomycetota bacterium]